MTGQEQADSGPGRGLPVTVYTVPPETPVFEVAQVMASEGVGDVLVAWDRKPIGLLTDRDLVVRVLAQGVNPKTLPVWEAMSKPLVLASGTQDIGMAVGLMARHGIRRLPIVDEAGRLESILTLDDILLLGLSGRPSLRAIIQEQLESKKAGVKPLAADEPGISFRNIAPITHAFSAAVAVARNRAQDVCTVTSEAPIREAAQAMVAQDVGDVFVVVDRKPVGILTDRDLVVRGMAVGADPETTLAWEVMTQPLVTVTDDEGVEGAVALMARHGIRRLPIVDDAGQLISVLTLDDILLLGLNGNLDLSEILKRQFRPRALPPRPDLPASAPMAPVAPPPSPPPSVIPAPLPEMRVAPPVAAAPQPQAQTQPTRVAPPSPPLKPAPGAVEPANLSSEAQGEATTLRPFPKSGRDSFGGVHFSKPVTSVARTTIIRPLTPYHRSSLDRVRAWLFGNWGWLEAMLWLLAVGVLLSVLASFAMKSGWLTIKHSPYEPKDEERQRYLERLDKERSEAKPPR